MARSSEKSRLRIDSATCAHWHFRFGDFALRVNRGASLAVQGIPGGTSVAANKKKAPAGSL